MPHVKKLVMHGFKSFAQKTEIPFSREINVILGPNGSGKCLTHDALVQLADGTLKSIGDLVNSKLANAVKTEDGYIAPSDGTKIMCLDLNKYKITKKQIKAFVKRTSPKKLLKIKTMSGKQITVTPYHPLFILKNNKIIPAKAEEINQSTKIAIPRKLPEIKPDKYFVELLDKILPEENIYVPYKQEFITILNELKKTTWKDLAYKIGISYYAIKGVLDKQSIRLYSLIKILRYAKLSDKEIINLIEELIMNGKKTKFNFQNSSEFSRFFGYLLAEGRLAKSSQIWFTNGNKEVVKDYVRLVKKLFNKKPLVREYKPNCWDIIIYSEPLKIILKKLGMASKTENKSITNILLKHSSNREISELIGAVFSGDGYVSKSKPYIDIVTKSKKLLQSLESCFLRLGIPYFSKKIKKSFKSFTSDYYQIIVSGTINLNIFSKNIPFIHKNKKNKLKKHLNLKQNPNIDLLNVNNLFKEIINQNNISIKKIKKQYPRVDSYYYNQCTPSRYGMNYLIKKMNFQKTPELNQLKKLINSQIYWDEVVSISEIAGKEWVYDLCVDEHHNFIANNIIVHNSNISDAICFVLGRLSIKSIRAAKASNLIYMGSGGHKPAKEAFVEIVFDNSDKTFNLPSNEVRVKRIVKQSGQSVYKINNETKTRNEVLELLATGGVDPYGFNIILQGEIQNFVKMKSEERRKIIEEVAGISIYETRKEKSLKELEKTDQKIKEISAILRERSTYLKNLEEERQQALKFKKLEQIKKRCRFSILDSLIKEKEKELNKVKKSINENTEKENKLKKFLEQLNNEINSLNERINHISNLVQKTSGVEQETLNQEISNLKAEIAGLEVRKESFESRLNENKKRIFELKKQLPQAEDELGELKKKSPIMERKQKDLEKKKKEFETIEEKRNLFLVSKNQIENFKDRIREKKNQLNNLNENSKETLNEIEKIEQNMELKDYDLEVSNLKKEINNIEEEINNTLKKEIEHQKQLAKYENEIEKNQNLKKDILKLDICPLCKNKITEQHINHVSGEAEEKISHFSKNINESQNKIKKSHEKRINLKQKTEQLEKDIEKLQELSLKSIKLKDRKQKLRELTLNENKIKQEIQELENKKREIEIKVRDLENIEEVYDKKKIEIEEISVRTAENLDIEISSRQREIEKTKIIIKNAIKQQKEAEQEINEIEQELEEKNNELDEKLEKNQEIKQKFQKLFDERNSIQKTIREKESGLFELQNNLRSIEAQINELKIENARVAAELENLEIDKQEFKNLKPIPGSVEKLKQKLQKIEFTLERIGNVNLRALQVYDSVKQEYEKIAEKVDKLEQEKLEILKIIEQIDRKKKKTFMKTLDSINELFTRNFMQLSSKGKVFLDLENKENVFDGGLSILVKLGKGKYFDVTSLSGGEQTLVALSLIFAIQEHKPYPFYILDEIDAALDKRNSERLGNLLKKYMKVGQYIVITHNDAIINEASTLYGVSMNQGISKVISLEV